MNKLPKWLWNEHVVLASWAICALMVFWFALAALSASSDGVSCPHGTQQRGLTCICPPSSPYAEPPVQTTRP